MKGEARFSRWSCRLGGGSFSPKRRTPQQQGLAQHLRCIQNQLAVPRRDPSGPIIILRNPRAGKLCDVLGG